MFYCAPPSVAGLPGGILSWAQGHAYLIIRNYREPLCFVVAKRYLWVWLVRVAAPEARGGGARS